MKDGPVTLQMILNAAMIIITAAGSLGVKLLLRRLDKLEEKHQKQVESLRALQVELLREYAPRAEVTRIGDKLFEALLRIEDKLDRKVDKH